MLRALFATLTNVNFSKAAFYDYVNKSEALASSLRSRVLEKAAPPEWCVQESTS
jgi:hydroxylamine reductase (hybrid-cluster protein)